METKLEIEDRIKQLKSEIEDLKGEISELESDLDFKEYELDKLEDELNSGGGFEEVTIEGKIDGYGVIIECPVKGNIELGQIDLAKIELYDGRKVFNCKCGGMVVVGSKDHLPVFSHVEVMEC